VLRADLANFFLFQYRAVDGFLITGKNSGTHWVKFMLSCAIAAQHGVEPPRFSSGREGDAIIAHPRWAPRHDNIPRIGSSHTIPSAAFAWRLKWLRPKPTVVLVRDIPAALLSNYVKWRAQYGVGLSEFLRGAPGGKRFVADIWWYIHFFNRWGDVARAWPGRVLFVHYEDVQAAPALWLERMAAHWGVALDARSIAAALPYVDREAVRARLDPGDLETVIPDDEDRAMVRFSAADRAALDRLLRRHLRHRLGYETAMSAA
jgi:hypothetical protein